jgi:multiple sugar transport system substrate-binding protein
MPFCGKNGQLPGRVVRSFFKEKTMKLRSLFCLVPVLFLLTGLSAFARPRAETSGKPVVSTVTRSSYATEQWYKDMNAAFTAETGIEVLVQVTTGNDDDHKNKVKVDLLAGGTVDVISTLGLRDQQGLVDAGFFTPLRALLRDAGIDATATWGKYLNIQGDGDFYDVPFKQEVYCVYYNKEMFDKAGLPYPSGAWTWEEYIATAKKLTDRSRGQYGSLMMNDTPWEFLPANQRGIPFYKPDGTSNFDHPAFAEALQWYYDLSHREGIQMNISQLLADNASWNYYALKDNLGLFAQGNWFTRLLNSQADYPRTWKYGITQMPSFGRDGNNTFISVAYVSINKNAAHRREALEYLVWLSKNQWRYEGGIPALANLSAEDQRQAFASTAAASNGQITVQDLYKCLMDNGMGVVQSDIIGVAATEYNAIVKEEAERFNLDQQDLATTVRRIVSRANEAIANAQ